MGSNLGGGGGFAEPRHILVALLTVDSPPKVIGTADLLQVGLQQLPVHPIDQAAELAGIDEQRLPAPIAETPLAVGSFALRQEPEAHRDLGAVEELAGPPGFRKDVTPFIRTPGGLMERINASLQRGRQG